MTDLTSRFRANLAYLIHERFGVLHEDTVLASALGVDHATINRIRSAERLPGPDRLEALSRYFAVPSTAWDLPHDEFVSECRRRPSPPAYEHEMRPTAVSMRTLEHHRHLWRRSHEIHQGQYIVYWKAFGQDGHYVASVLEIQELGDNGISFALINPYIRDDDDGDEVRTWKYTGAMYPVADYLYFFGEQTEGNYELFSMMTTASPIAPPDILRGCLMGVHVKDGKKQIAVNIAIVLMFLKKPVAGWRQEIGERLGKLPAGKVPERIRRMVDPYPGVIPLA